MFDNIDSWIDGLKEVVSDMDSLTNVKVLSGEKIESRSRAIVDMWSLLRITDSQFLQRSRTKWFKDGNSKPGYIHASMKSRGKQNIILDLKVGDGWIKEVSKFMQEVV